MFRPGKIKAARMIIQIVSLALIGYVSFFSGHLIWPIPKTLNIFTWLIFSLQWVIIVTVIQPKNARFRHIQEEAEFEFSMLGGDMPENIDQRSLIKRRMADYVFMPLILSLILSGILLITTAI